MEDPVNEIRGVVKGLVAARNASEQKYIMQQYFAPDASFDHLLCTVASGPKSRDNGILPIYQWLRCFSASEIEVYSVGKFGGESISLYTAYTPKFHHTHTAFDEKSNKLYVRYC